MFILIYIILLYSLSNRICFCHNSKALWYMIFNLMYDIQSNGIHDIQSNALCIPTLCIPLIHIINVTFAWKFALKMYVFIIFLKLFYVCPPNAFPFCFMPFMDFWLRFDNNNKQIPPQFVIVLFLLPLHFITFIITP